jgi:hypothetical protein
MLEIGTNKIVVRSIH